MCQLGLYLSFLCLILSCLAANDIEDTSCKSSGLAGKCKRVPDCPLALESIKKSGRPHLKRCGFDGSVEIVCCPVATAREPSEIGFWVESSTDTVQQNRFTKRKCEQACEELSNEVKSKVDFHIISGENAKIEEFPHMAALGYDSDEGIQWDCSASIISKRYLLTAAHCITRRVTPKRARLGVTKLNDTNPQDYIIHNITVNPRYNPSSKHHDIALIEMKKDIQFSEKMYPACLYYENDDPLGLIITGWGKTSISSEDDRSNILQKALLVPAPLKDCNTSYSVRSFGTKTIINAQICAGSDTSDACWGDSGGPLQIQNKAGSYSLVGIISYGAGCGGKLPGVYTRVSRYLDWIESIVWP